MRKLAKKMRDETEEMEDEKIDVRREDKTIRPFDIPVQDIYGDIVTIESVKVIVDHEPIVKETQKILKKRCAHAHFRPQWYRQEHFASFSRKRQKRRCKNYG